MRKITVLHVLLLLMFCSVHSQTTNLQKAQSYIQSKGEVCFTFTANSEAQFQEIANFLSIGHKINRETLEIEAYANAETFDQFLAYGLPYTVNESDNEFNPNFDTLAWDVDWNAYPTYTQYVAKMNYFASTYPNLCTLESIGNTNNGRELLMLKISDNVSTNEAEPEFMYTSSMHGNELAGFPLMIRLAEYLLSNYGSDAEVDNIVNSTVIYINPLANPDGAYRDTGNNVINNPRRGNANNVDLNRNYADNVAGIHYDGVYEVETVAFMKFEEAHDIVLSANFHGGIELVNYPYDNTYDQHADHDWFEYISVEYATNAQNNSPAGYMTVDEDFDVYPSPGVTHGAEWYRVFGGRQDYMNFYRGGREVVVELSNTKWIQGSAIDAHWDYNKQAFLDYMKQVNFGFQGIISDESGNPIKAKVSIAGHDNLNSFIFSNEDFGDYYRLIKGGSYNVTFEAPGYVTQNINVTVTDNMKTIQNVTMVASTSTPTSNNVTINENQSASLSASGTGTINWYQNVDDDTPVYTGANYSTPNLTTTTSYFVEDEIPVANVGSTNYNANGGFFAGGTGDRYLVFNNTQPVELERVTINAQQAGEMEIQLQDSSGNTLDSRLILVESAGVQQIDLNFFIPVGNDMRLASTEMSSGFSLYRNNSGATYPYTNGSITITNNNINNLAYYYFFYDWEIASLKSARQEVVVTVEDTLGVEENTIEAVSIYPNPFTNSVTIKLPTQSTSSNIGIELYDVSGRSILNIEEVTVSNGQYSLQNIENISSGSYFMKITDNETNNQVVKRLIKQ
ncbi:M14 family zinc carboxypeptidase [uncultured Psychroserpens sp.]|uniref:M14 family zinc carboxypeptidase n=1 Tax=uncultured Psychroserpens sp. TaxID=255436 RepID=UPI002631E936|nr:M14 family zinc carboxypeptidase [uncultured Psychroserpens sp.]